MRHSRSDTSIERNTTTRSPLPLERRRREWAQLFTNYSPWLALAVCLLTTLLVYARALSYPFFYDDTFDLSRTESQSFLSLLAGIDGYAYYRPLPFMIWKTLYLVQGRYDPVVLHGLSLLAHSLAGWLLFLLLRRFTGSVWALVPALLFLTFPFSYQVVPIAGSLFHALVALFILATLSLYADGRIRQRPHLILLSLITTALALWTHEYGVLVLGYLLGLEAVLLLSHKVRRPSPWLLGHLAVGALFLLVWTSVAKAPSPVPANRDELIQKALFFLQGMAYPVTAQLIPLQGRFGHEIGERTLLFGGLAVLVALATYLLQGRRALIALIAVAWIVVALLPVWWRLNWPYVENAPRLLYLAAAGAATFWGLLLSIRFRRPWLTVAWRAAGLLMVALVIVQSIAFISIRMDMLRYGGQLVDGVTEAGEAHPGGSLLFLNVPSWFVQHQRDYPRGNLGVTMMPSYIGLDRVIYTHTGAQVRVESLGFRAETNSWRFGWQPHGPEATAEQVDAAIRGVDEVYGADLTRENVAIRPIGGLIRDDSTAPSIATLGSGVSLSRAGVDGTSDRLSLTLDWQVHAPLSGEHEVLIQARDEAGVPVAEWRGYALNDTWAPRLWQAGDRIADRSVLRLPEPTGSGPYTVWLGLVGPDGSLLPVVSEAGMSIDGGLLRIGTVPE